jgi:Zn-dependent alcohol dehydrogenase
MKSRAAVAWEAGKPLEIEEIDVQGPREGEVMVRALYSGISRGTETLVYRGEVPDSQHDVMRAPFQDGDFPGPSASPLSRSN